MTGPATGGRITPARHHGSTGDSPGSRIRTLRSALGLTQEQMAQRLDVSFATVNRWEMGRRLPSTASQLRLDALEASAASPSADRSLGGSELTAQFVFPTRFIGRVAELRELEGLLKANRLLTLIGPGGAGKTRLALEQLIRRSTNKHGPVTLVALDVVSDPALVASAVCAALGLRDAAGKSPEDQVIAHLATAPRLLVLDNCEHVVEAAGRLVGAALAAAPQLRVVATSRIVRL